MYQKRDMFHYCLSEMKLNNPSSWPMKRPCNKLGWNIKGLTFFFLSICFVCVHDNIFHMRHTRSSWGRLSWTLSRIGGAFNIIMNVLTLSRKGSKECVLWSIKFWRNLLAKFNNTTSFESMPMYPISCLNMFCPNMWNASTLLLDMFDCYHSRNCSS